MNVFENRTRSPGWTTAGRLGTFWRVSEIEDATEVPAVNTHVSVDQWKVGLEI
jgi:hypothetical protein